MPRLLLLSCSRQKRTYEGLSPAVDRYDGPAFRVFRRYRDHQPVDLPHVFVLSAEHGLITSETPIAWYDREMSSARVDALRPIVVPALRRRLEESPSAWDVCLYAGVLYRSLVEETLRDAHLVSPITVPSGPPGVRLVTLRHWLYGDALPVEEAPVRSHGSDGQARLGDVTVSFTPDEIVNRVRCALYEEPSGADRYYSWCAVVEGRPVAPKWLANILTDLPVSRFTTDEARRMLTALSVEVKRV